MTHTEAAAQIRRLAAQRYYAAVPSDGLSELANTLVAIAPDVKAATAIIDQWLTVSREMPTPMDLRAIADAMVPDRAPGACLEVALLDRFRRPDGTINARAFEAALFDQRNGAGG